jgi:hypothetical protein
MRVQRPLYISIYNPEVFVKIYIASNGWVNIAFNHVTVDELDVYSAHHYNSAYDQHGTATLTNRLVDHTYHQCFAGLAKDAEI